MSLRTGDPRVALRIRQWYRTFERSDAVARERFELGLSGYDYSLLTADTRGELLSFHWHPEAQEPVGMERTVTFYHLHVGGAALSLQALKKVHVPTGPVTLSEVVRMVIEDFGVTPLRRDWRSVLA